MNLKNVNYLEFLELNSNESSQSSRHRIFTGTFNILLFIWALSLQ